MANGTIHSPNQPSEAALAWQLEHLGLPFVGAASEDAPFSALSTEALIAALADSKEARLRMALIPLFVANPGYAYFVPRVRYRLVGQAKVTLVCYYTAAVLLQRKYAQRLARLGLDSTELPDLFSHALELLPSDDTDAQLVSLAEQQARMSGRSLNWYGTYVHAIERFIRRMELEAEWRQS
jgi:hypothetical protein